MPYEIRHVGHGRYKVFNIITNKSYSNKPMSLENAKKQIIILRMNSKYE